MLRIRLFEESLIPGILSGEIKTPCHLCIGQEAVAVGVCRALRSQDVVFGNHRSHGHYLAKGGDMKALCAEIYGKETGCSKGRGGSMHLADPEVGFMGSVPIVAGTAALAVGAAMAFKMRGEDRIAVSFFGDGAMQEGIVYEALNLAKLHRLPILFVCENNQYATHMRLQDCLFNPPHVIAQGLGYSTKLIDGNSVMDVYSAVLDTLEYSNLPEFIECWTYRLCGHVGPDDNILGEHLDIRPKKEVDGWRLADPTVSTEWTTTTLNSVRKEVEESHQFAKESRFPDSNTLENYVYAD
jgi:pyruvate dehydrogenase E1 component alpha subunit